MRIVDDAFIYRLLWAIEAVRMRRRANGGQSEFIEGSAAATLETGLPQMMMAMLVRTGVPSRVAAMKVVTEAQPAYVTVAEMNQWLRSNEVAALTGQPDWPTPETADIWKQFRNEALAGRVQKWFSQDWQMDYALDAHIDPTMPGRINVDAVTGGASVTTADYIQVIGIQHRLRQLAPSLLHVDFAADRKSARIVRLGRGEARWELPA